MIHTKTQPGHYDSNDYWTVSYIDISSDDPSEHQRVVKEYRDVDNAYEDYCYYQKKWWAKDCQYDHHRR